MNSTRKYNNFRRYLIIIFCILFPSLLAIIYLSTFNYTSYDVRFRSWLNYKLICNKPLPSDFITDRPQIKKVVYVLGGTQDSLSYRYRTAANLYRCGQVQKILILSRQGITDYDLNFKRNLTNDEWSEKKLEEFGINKNSIEFLTVSDGFFGTLAEAKVVSKIVVNRRFDVLILVTSTYHTSRVALSFSKYLKDKQVNMFVYGSDDAPGVWGLVFEYCKLLTYKYILL